MTIPPSTAVNLRKRGTMRLTDLRENLLSISVTWMEVSTGKNCYASTVEKKKLPGYLCLRYLQQSAPKFMEMLTILKMLKWTKYSRGDPRGRPGISPTSHKVSGSRLHR